MSQLIPIQQSEISNQTIQTVNARELHGFLKSKQDFSDWMKKRIKQYGFVEDQDYIRLHKKMEANNATVIDYHLSLDMAKELSMVERNARGKEARQYFLDCEKIAQQPIDPMKALNDPAAMRGILLTYTEKVIALEEEKKILTPKAEALDRLTLCEGAHNITNTAKQLDIQPKKLFTMLSANRWIYRRVGGKSWTGYQDKIQQGLLTHKVTTVQSGDGSERMFEQVLVTPKGVTKIAEKLLATA